MAWLFANLTNGMVVLCVSHNDHQQIEFALKENCPKPILQQDCCNEPLTTDLCFDHHDCTDIPVQVPISPALHLQRDIQINLLAIAPLQLNSIALLSDLPHHLATQPRHDNHAPPRPDDPATTTGSILLLI
jgi:hypothetical protein